MKNFKRVLSLALVALMVIGGLVVAPVDAKAETTYTKVTSLSELTEGTKFVIVASYGSKYYAPGTKESKGFTPVQVSLEDLSNATVFEITAVSNGKYGIKTPTEYIKAAEKKFTFSSSALAADWTIESTENETFQFSGSNYYIAYNSSGYLRCYVDKSSNSSYVQKWMVYKINDGSTSGGTTPEEPSEPTPTPQPTAGTIAEALAGATDSLWTVKGVVTLVDGANIYIQDATGGIDAYFSSKPTDIKLGDTIEVTGSRAAYKGLPELANATYTKSSGLTLEAKTTTIAALTTADICTYVKITGLTVTELVDKKSDGTPYTSPNLTVEDAEGNTIQIYKAVVDKVDGEWAIQVGDKIDVLASVGVYNTTLQLRNTLASEITKVVVEEEPSEDPSENPSEDPSESESESESQAPSESESEKEELTAKDILAEAAKLEDGQYLGGSKDVKYTLKGVITKYEFNEQYGDASITIKVDGTDETFYCYQVKGEDVKNLKVGDHIELNGAIKNYKGTIEFERPNLVAILPTGDFSSVGTVMILIAGVACLAVAFTSKKKMA